MAKKPDAASASLLAALCGDPALRLVAADDGSYRFSDGATRAGDISAATVRRHLAAGLLAEVDPGAFAATHAASAWLRRRANGDRPFRAQHGTLVEKKLCGDGTRVVVELDESPVATLARRVGKGGEPWLKPHAAEAAERLRRDFELGRLQPRVTANWSASVSTSRRSDGAGLADLTDMALAARLRFDRAMRAVGPELSGVLVDVCCFLKGLEAVERERRWPARSAKLALRIALEALARHYGLAASATGRPGSGKLRHWGAEDYRPEIA
jgi:Domain of unknown function (DUF6456)